MHHILFFLVEVIGFGGKNWGIFDADSMMHKYSCYIWYKNTKYGTSFTSGYRLPWFQHPMPDPRHTSEGLCGHNGLIIEVDELKDLLVSIFEFELDGDLTLFVNIDFLYQLHEEGAGQ